MNSSSEIQINQEVRIRLLEAIASNIDNRFKNVDQQFDKLEAKMDSQFHWVLGTILTFIATTLTLFGGIILHLAKLI